MSSQWREEYLLEVEKNPERLNALFSPFRRRQLNADSYDRKMNFWVKFIREYLLSTNRIFTTMAELQELFKYNGRTPACLEEVFEKLRSEGNLMTEGDFAYLETGSDKWPNWISYAFVPMKWFIGQAAAFYPTNFPHPFKRSITPEDPLLFIPSLQKIGAEFPANLSLFPSAVMGVEAWKNRLSALYIGLRPKDIDMLVRHLKTRRILAEDKVGNEEILKMFTLPQDLPKISDVEKSSYDLQRTKTFLEQKLGATSRSADEAKEQARKEVKQGHRLTALHHLRTGKKLEKECERWINYLDNIIAIGLQIETCESDAMVIKTYQEGTRALKRLVGDQNIDKVVNTMLDLEEVMAESVEISEALSNRVADDVNDTDELELELETLMKESLVTPGSDEAIVDQMEALALSDDLNPLKDADKPSEGLSLLHA